MSDTYQVAGAGSPEWDGLYVQDGTYNGYPLYSLDSSHWLGLNSFSECYVLARSSNIDSVSEEYRSPDNNPASSGWWTGGGTSVDPAPTVTLYTGGGDTPATGNMLLMF